MDVVVIGLEQPASCPVLAAPRHPHGVGAEQRQLTAGGDELLHLSLLGPGAEPGEG